MEPWVVCQISLWPCAWCVSSLSIHLQWICNVKNRWWSHILLHTNHTPPPVRKPFAQHQSVHRRIRGRLRFAMVLPWRCALDHSVRAAGHRHRDDVIPWGVAASSKKCHYDLRPSVLRSVPWGVWPRAIVLHCRICTPQKHFLAGAFVCSALSWSDMLCLSMSQRLPFWWGTRAWFN